MRHWLASAIVASATCVAGIGNAADQPVVVELFTSQGCSSCLLADNMIGELAERDDVIALALHVDYWDYIGWKDVFASPSNTKRQKGYARAAGQRTIYTPQLIVGGTDRVVGYRPMEVADLIQRQRAKPDAVLLEVERNGGRMVIRAKAVARVGKMVVLLARFTPSASVAIDRGENAGKTITYFNVVRSLQPLAEWDGAAPLTLEAAAPDGAAAVLVQAVGLGPILAAARLR